MISEDSIGKLLPCGSVDPVQDFYRACYSNYTYDPVTGKSTETCIPFPNVTANTNYVMHNTLWTSNGGTILLLIGPLICNFIMVNFLVKESSSKVLGLLRSLGMSETAYWLSWFAIFSIIVVVNSLFAAGIGKATESVVFMNSSYGPVFLTYWLYQTAMIPICFLTAIIAGTSVKAGSYLGFFNFLFALFLMLGLGFAALTSSGPISLYSGVDYSYMDTTPSAFWVHASTIQCSQSDTIYLSLITGEPCLPYNSTSGISDVNCQQGGTSCSSNDTCSLPIVESNVQSNITNQYYDGQCYVIASTFDQWYGGSGGAKFGLAVFFFMPYFHFGRLFSLMLGATSLPSGKFTSSMMSLDLYNLVRMSSPQTHVASTSIGTLFMDYDQVTASNPNNIFDNDGRQLFNCPIVNGVCRSGNVQCPILDKGPISSGRPSFGDTLGSLVGITIFFLLLTIWFGQVFTSGNGVPKKFWFPFTLSFWKKKFMTSHNSVQNQICNAQSVEKYFGDFRALSNASISLVSIAVVPFRIKFLHYFQKMNEIYCLLGHNGSGKSTLIKVMTGDHLPSSGDCNIFGYSVVEQVDKVRTLVGLCPQDDYLYDDLTAEEHLELFAILRGVSMGDELVAIVDEWLEDVNLSDVRTHLSCTYSGGMKRRLSLALATIGDTKLVVLDEPTTGMDPVNRRYIWRHIQKVRKNRCVLLTTHALEEADLLADYVAIMHQGRVVAEGTPMELKHEYGAAIQFDMLTEETQSAQVFQKLETMFSSFDPSTIQLKMGASGNITLSMKDNEAMHNDEILDSFLGLIQAENGGIVEYGISNSSLDEVFIKVTGNHTDFAVEATTIDVCCSCCSQSCIACCLTGCCKCCCCIKTTVGKSSNLEEEHTLATEKLAELTKFESRVDLISQFKGMTYKSLKSQWTGKRSIFPYILLSLFTLMSIVIFFLVPYSPSQNSVIAVVITCVSLALTLPFLVSPLAEERQLGLWGMMQQQGLHFAAYYASEIVYTFAIQLVYNFLYLSLMMMTFYYRGDYNSLYQSDNVPSTGGYGQLVGVMFAFACCTPGTVLFFAPLFKSFRMASAIMFLYALGVSILCAIAVTVLMTTENMTCLREVSLLCDLGNNDACVISSSAMTAYCVPPAAALFPYLGLPMMMSMYFGSDIQTLGASSAPTMFPTLMPALSPTAPTGFPTGYVTMSPTVSRTTSSISNALVHDKFNTFFGYTLLGALLWLGVGLAISHAILFTPRWLSSLLYKVSNVFCFANSNGSSKQHGVEIDEVDMDVIEETSNVVDALKNPKSRSILTHELRKVYPGRGGRPSKEALVTLSLQIKPGDVLGLLGPNGAGKTSAIKILAGTNQATSGVAYVLGSDIRLDKNTVYENLGNCPQFDIIWPHLTVRQHLEFYARLKGVPDPNTAAMTLANGIGLVGGALLRPAGALSGGMRRRLSIGISLMGGPSVVLLDEPSTGLDPVTRHQIWELIELLKTPERAFIITTHMMLEADTLCNRIAIVTKGRLKVIGTQRRLKNRFGDGYIMVVNLMNDSKLCKVACMEYLVKNVHSGARLANAQAKTLRVSLPSDLSLKVTFMAMFSKSAASEGCINQWLLNQASLEDVFVNVAGADEADLKTVGFTGSGKGFEV